MWLKLIVCGLSIAFCTLLGWLAAGKYRARRSFFAQAYDLNEKYLAELEYRRAPLTEFLRSCKFSGDFGKAVENFLSAKPPLFDLDYLTQEEREEVRSCFSQLGRGDTAAELGFFGGKRASLLDKKNSSAKEAAERGELYTKLGLLAGLAFVILIV